MRTSGTRKGAYIAAIAFGVALAAAPGMEASAESSTEAEAAAYKELYLRPPARAPKDPALVELGRQLFWDPRLSASASTACVTCHQPYLGWATTDARSRGDAGKPTSRKSQALLGIGYADGAPVGWDGRNASLEAQITSSIKGGSMSLKGTDKPVDVATIVARIQAVPEYVERFAAIMPGAPIDLDTIARAVAEYERHIEPGVASFDRWLGGDDGAVSESAKRGFVLFNTAANCVACHSGWRFTDDLFHDIGTSSTDRGRGKELASDETMQFAFKTPTLRSVALRPPYMHNGSARSLYEVVVHYEKGGIDRPSRSPLMTKLTLTERDRIDLVAFMQTLSGLPEGEAPPPLPGVVTASR